MKKVATIISSVVAAFFVAVVLLLCLEECLLVMLELFIRHEALSRTPCRRAGTFFLP